MRRATPKGRRRRRLLRRRCGGGQGALTALPNLGKVRIIEIGRQCLIVIGNRAGVIPLAGVDYAAIVVGLGIIRIEPDPVVEVSDRAIILALAVVGDAAIAVGGDQHLTGLPGGLDHHRHSFRASARATPRRARDIGRGHQRCVERRLHGKDQSHRPLP